MADNDGKILYSLELDGEQFQKTLDQVNDKLGNLEKISKKAEFPVTVASWAAGIAVFEKSLEVAGKVLDQVFEAEKIEKINKSFLNLAASAGIVGNSFKDNLIKAADGLIDDTDLIKAANTAMVNFGKSAEKLPDVLLLARKAAAAGYGELPDVFNALNQAISSGNTKALRQYQIFIDNEKAAKQYAASIGVSAGALTQAGRSQATLNALLDYSNGKFKNLSIDSGQATDAVTRMKVSLQGLGEAIQKVFLLAAPVVSKAANAIASVVDSFTEWANSITGGSAQGVQDQINGITLSLDRMQKKQQQMIAEGGPAAAQSQDYKLLSSYIEKNLAELNKLQAKQREITGEGKQLAAPSQSEEVAKVDYGKLKQERSQFENDILQMRQARLQKEVEAATTEAQVVELAGLQVKNIEDQKAQQLDALRLKKQESAMTDQQYADMRVEIEARSAEQIAEITRNLEQAKLNAYQNEVKAATSNAQGIAAAFKQGSAQSRAELSAFGAMGQKTYQNFSSKAVNALQELGAGTKSATEVAKGFILGMLADEAQARGQVMLLASIFPPNPVGLAAGAGLIALSGALRSMGGAKASSGSIPSLGGSANGTGYEVASGSASPNAAQFTQPKRQVTIQIQGSYFETEQTKTRLLEMIREGTDATDFKYVQIPGVR
ncbi:MAG: hypothetical protein BWZ03_00092 [bacterium ADurb.BinA186]|nr:MAG: hypothetical protein BWZ03_00092 [bacterium ADurb.BinA186]